MLILRCSYVCDVDLDDQRGVDGVGSFADAATRDRHQKRVSARIKAARCLEACIGSLAYDDYTNFRPIIQYVPMFRPRVPRSPTIQG